MNVNLRGKTKQIIEDMVKEGYANTLSEAIRIAIINFGDVHNKEERLTNEKLDRIDEQIRRGRRRVLTAKQAMGKYSKYIG